MREATPEELKSVNDYIKSISYNPIVKELEKIKTEIKEESYYIINIDEDFYDLGYRIVDIDDINEIIDKRISEMKGIEYGKIL